MKPLKKEHLVLYRLSTPEMKPKKGKSCLKKAFKTRNEE